MKNDVLFTRRNDSPPQVKSLTQLKRVISKSFAATALLVVFFCSSNAQAIDSFFDIYIDLWDSSQVAMEPADSGAFPFPPPPLNFPDLGTAGTIDIEMVALSLRSSQPMAVGDPDPTSGQFIVDSFFDVFYEISATDSTGVSTFTVDSFFDIAYSMEVTPLPPEILPTGEESRGFDTEILSMDLTGSHPVDLFGDPDFDFSIQLIEGQAGKSDGHVTVLKSPGGGDFNIDSFFDVFVEISVDGGPYVPSVENSQLRLQSHNLVTIPEPSSCALLTIALAAASLANRRRERA